MSEAIQIGLSLLSASGERDAQQDAADLTAETAAQNIAFLETQGQAGADLIAESSAQARAISEGIAGEAGAQIQPFAQGGTEAFRQAQQRILTGETGGGIAERVGGAAFQATGDPIVDAALQREASLIGRGTGTQVNQRLLGQGRIGLQGASDIASLEQRGAARTGGIINQAAIQRGSALLGLAPQIAQQDIQVGEARALGDVARRQSNIDIGNQLARLTGRVA